MDFSWVAIALGDVAWLSLVFVLGLLARAVGLPPLVGFLAAGFVLNTQGFSSNEMLQKLADLGITLLLFTIGLKLNLRTLARPQVWAVTGLHMAIIAAVFGLAIYGLALAGSGFVMGLSLQSALIIAFALSFSSTVFVAKLLEDKGEMASLHGRIAIGILIMQDIVAVIFLAVSMGQLPSLWAIFLVLLIPLRPLLHRVLQGVGRGELLVLYGFLLAMGGAEVFELVGMKGDLGALIFGVLIANHSRSEEMAKIMLSFKDLFLVGFFLTIGLTAQASMETLMIGVLITPLVFLKAGLFFVLLMHYKLRARTALLTSLNLINYSEFGLIVTAIGVKNGWVESKWLVVIAIAIALSFAIAAALNAIADGLYARYRTQWRRWQKNQRLPDDRLLELEGVTIAIVGMGRIGTGAYDTMREQYGEVVVGIDINPVIVNHLQESGRKVLLGDPSDADFWDRVQETHSLKLMLLSLPKLDANLSVLERLGESSFNGQVAVSARFPDEVEILKQSGATTVFNIYTEAGVGFATHVVAQLPQ